MHAMTPYLLQSYDRYNKEEKKQEYFTLSNIKGHDLLDLIHTFMSSRSAHVYDFPEEKRVYKFSDIKYEPSKRTICAFLVAGFYGVDTDIIDKNTGKVTFPKTTNDAEVLRHFVQFTVPSSGTEGIVLFHKSRGVGIKTFFDKLFKPFYLSQTQTTLQINPYAHTEAVKEWAKNAKVKAIKVKGFVGSSDLASNISLIGECNTDFTITPKIRKKGFTAMLGNLKDFLDPEPDSSINQMITFLEGQGSKVRTVAMLNGSTRTFDIGTNDKGVVCDIPFAEDEDDVELIGGQPEYESTRLWSINLTNDILRGVYGKKAFQIPKHMERRYEHEDQSVLID